jgi:hypothetical protein
VFAPNRESHKICESYNLLQLLARASQEIAEALIHPQPLPVQAYAHDPHWRRVERRSIEALALDQVGRARAHLAFKPLAVLVVIGAVGP